jgi:phospholipid/cholesterol/gamma-HCH transport system substrate-binding protein
MAHKLFGNKVLGVLFVGLLVLGVWLVNAVFTQKFVSYDKVALQTSTIGLQLPSRADVKVRGVIVGEVTKAVSDKPGSGATLTLGIDPDKIGEIPKNVSASILPKTLFGEKYVSLDIPDSPSSSALRAGDVITQTQMPIEVERVLNDIYPLLRTVQPAELNYTLNALADALEGRGEKLGESIVTLDGYLKRLNPQVPGIVNDLKELAKVSDTYADVLPQIAATLRNTVKTGDTLVTKQAKLHQFLDNVSAFSDTGTQFLDANGQNLIRLGQVSQPTLALLKRYSPEYPCLFKGLVGAIPRLASTFRGFIFHIELEFLPKQPRGYGPQDKPVYGANNPPTCAGLPNPPGSQAHPYNRAPNFNDGVNGLGRGDNQRPAPAFALASGTAGTADQRALIDSLTAPALGVPVDEVPGITTLLFGPLAAGTEVSMR